MGIMRKRSIGKRAAACFLAAGLVLGLLGGCRKGEVREETGSLPAEGSTQAETPAQDKGELKAMGRYRETEVGLPEEIKDQSYIRFMRGEGGNLELYTADREMPSGKLLEAFRYVCRGGNWERDEGWAGNGLAKDMGLDLSYVDYGGDGKYYLGGTDEAYQYHLFRMEEDGRGDELLAQVFAPTEGRDYGIIPPKFEVLENGNILIYDYYQIDVYEPSGNRLYSIAKDFSGTTSDARGFSQGEELVTVQEGVMVKYSLKDGKLLETIPIDEVKGNREGMELFGDGAGGVYAANEEGLSHISKDGTMWEVLIDGSLNHMGMRSMHLRCFLPGKDGEFYGAFTAKDEGFQLFCYQYDPDMEAVPPQAITVYSLNDHSTVRQAASVFQSQHPEVKVDVRTAVEDGEEATEEMIRSLNTELLGGKGADVLILDGLPADSYIEKGILMDFGSLARELAGSGALAENILEGFIHEDGGVYQIPARIALPIVLGQEKAVKAYESLEAMAGYQGEKPLVSAETYENLLRMTANLQYEEVMGGQSGLSREKLIQCLKTVKAVGEASGAKTFFSEEEIERNLSTNYVAKNGILGTSIFYDMGRCDSGLECVDGFGTLCIPVQVRVQNPGSDMVSVGGKYFPSVLAGVNRSGENTELAMEFIRCLLSDEVQKEELYDGFPVNLKALEAMTEDDRPGYSVSSGFCDYQISGEWPKLEVRREVMESIKALSVPVCVDETVMEMMVEGSRDYFEGKETAEAAADKIMRKMSIYQAE